MEVSSVREVTPTPQVMWPTPAVLVGWWMEFVMALVTSSDSSPLPSSSRDISTPMATKFLDINISLCQIWSQASAVNQK